MYFSTKSESGQVTKTANSKAATNRKAVAFKKRIGHTTYRVGIHFSGTSRETMDEKIIRLIRNESADRKAAINE